jgi:hypothetical protein
MNVNDTVQIVTPEFFVRCGFPLDEKDEATHIRQNYGPKLLQFIQTLGIETSTGKRLKVEDIIKSKIFYEVCDSIAWGICNMEDFGGKEKTIYTKSFPELENRIFQVIDVKHVTTGVFNQDSRTNRCAAETLEEDVVHQICQIAPLDEGQKLENNWIEANNLEIV